MEKDDEVKGSGNSLDFDNRIYDSRLGRFLSLDRLTAQFPWQSPYIFAGNTPIQAIDKNGDKIYFVGINDNFVKAFEALAKTPDGAALIAKYWLSKTDDVYFTVTDIDLRDEAGFNVAGMTYPSDRTNEVIKDGKIDFTGSNDKSIPTEGFENLQGLDVSQSKGKNIALITIDNNDLKNGDAFTGAETEYHELKSHVDLSQSKNFLKHHGVSRILKEHDLYNGILERTKAKGDIWERDDPNGDVVKKGVSFFGRITKQLNDVKSGKKLNLSNSNTSTKSKPWLMNLFKKLNPLK